MVFGLDSAFARFWWILRQCLRLRTIKYASLPLPCENPQNQRSGASAAQQVSLENLANPRILCRRFNPIYFLETHIVSVFQNLAFLSLRADLSAWQSTCAGVVF